MIWSHRILLALVVAFLEEGPWKSVHSFYADDLEDDDKQIPKGKKVTVTFEIVNDED